MDKTPHKCTDGHAPHTSKMSPSLPNPMGSLGWNCLSVGRSRWNQQFKINYHRYYQNAGGGTKFYGEQFKRYLKSPRLAKQSKHRLSLELYCKTNKGCKYSMSSFVLQDTCTLLLVNRRVVCHFRISKYVRMHSSKLVILFIQPSLKPWLWILRNDCCLERSTNVLLNDDLKCNWKKL